MRLRRVIACLVFSLTLTSCRSIATEQSPLPPEVQRRVSTVLLARSIRAYSAMAHAGSNCLVKSGRLQQLQADRALAISLQALGISPAVLLNPLVQQVSPRLQALLLDDCSLDPEREQEALSMFQNDL